MEGPLLATAGAIQRVSPVVERVRAERMEHAQAQAAKQAAHARHLQAFVDRFNKETGGNLKLVRLEKGDKPAGLAK